ncbi:MAG: Hcp family type VI secretion system effector [Dehalococcoidia bacterium]
MAFDMFLKIGTIAGESTDEKHTEWIECLSYSHGVTQPTTVRSSAAGIASERADHMDFTVVKTLDKASPKLNLKCSNGEQIGEVIVELARATGDKQKYMEYVMTDVIVSSVRPEGNAQGEGTVPLEEVSFNYGKIQWTYTETDPQTGQPKGDVKASWDLISNSGG